MWTREFCIANGLIILSAISLSLNASEGERSSLKYVDELFVVVENLGQDLKEIGLTEEQLKVDMELKLRLAKIQVSADAMSYLYLKVNGVRWSDMGLACSISLQFHQRVVIVDQAFYELAITKEGSEKSDSTGVLPIWFTDLLPMSCFASTWDTGSVGFRGIRTDVKGAIRNAVKDKVDEFINDFLAAKQERANTEK
jgi:hypothetical protein